MTEIPSNLSIYIAKIEDIAIADDMRIQVRVMPHMEDLLDVQYLPWWPSFFKEQCITGKKGDLVWVIADSEFTTGFVLGYVGSYSWTGRYETASITQETFDRITDAYVDLRGRLFSFADLIITYWDSQSIHFVDRSNGSHITAFTSGTVSVVRPDEILLAVNGKSMLKISETDITLSADTVHITGDVRLGTNPKGSVLVTQGVLGKNGEPSESVWA